ncbi:hypothetical protein [Pseudomonas putida]|uniref:hypothetical protein n=1 Tax=Pseudomonas putida TaxID=303 RepID=UPI00236516CB|nr:hypothetical protein [Pseudomonas putida]MDD2047746.1 hypothetical protein [Pseudomonas putida]
MQATFNLKTALGVMSWACGSSVVTLILLLFPALQFQDYLGLWPIGLSVLVTVILFVTYSFAKRDHKVSISIIPEGLMFRDEADDYNRQELIQFDWIRSVRVRRNPFFQTLIIDLKEQGQRYTLSNVLLPENFLLHIQARIGVANG